MQQKILTVLFFISLASFSFAEDKQVDSLKALLAHAKDDTSRVNLLLALSKEYVSSDPVQTISIASQAKELAEKLHFQKGLAYAYKNIGIGYYNQTKNIETLDNWVQSLAVFDSLDDKVGEANMLSNIGSLYYNQASYEKALENYLQSLKISEAINDTFRIATACINIGNVYGEKKGTSDKALQYYLRTLLLSENSARHEKSEDEKKLIGSALVGIGEIYFKYKDKPDTALYYFKQSLETYEGTEDVPYSLNYIGKVDTKRGDFDAAVKNHRLAYELSKKLDAKLDMTQSLSGLGNAYEAQGNFKAAIATYQEAESIAKEIDARTELKDAYKGLASSYSKVSDFRNAYTYQNLLTDIKDSIYNIETDKKLGSLQFDFDIYKKQGQLDLKEHDLKKQRVIKYITIAGLLVVMLFLVVVFFQKKRIVKEKKRSDELLLNILPEETAEELKQTGTAKAKKFDEVTVLFTDFKNFTQASELLSAEDLVKEINYCYSEFDRIITKYKIEKIKTIGDSYMCAGGLPAVNSTNPEDVVRAGLEMQAFISRNKEERIAQNQPYFDLRLGIHTGPVVAGIVGIKKFAYDIWGDTVNTASRMESSGEIGKVNVSGATYELVKDKFNCTHRGKIQAKNKGEIDMYFVNRSI